MSINTANLVAFYNLENANDDSGNGRNLTNNNTATFTSAKIVNGATLVRASSQWLSLLSDTSLNLGGSDWTICLWVNRSASGNFEQPIGCGWDETPLTTKSSYTLYTRSDNNRFAFQWYNAGYKELQLTTTTISNGTWYFVCIRGTGGNIYLSVNAGTPASTAGSLQTTSGGTFGIGRGGATGTAYFGGQIDAVGIWKGYSLSDSEVTELYNGGAGLQFPFSSTTIKTYNGVVTASVKTVLNNTPIANRKTWNGIV